ncbi:TPA: putative sulfate exporter family transporter [Candidatus Sumerlaeota bacterium]|jgi:uncharacterized integral membrane protein (TIGR00698 family)|nr:putative sulfate exporter family transporter [Candidatus Sumerlaeota bacterium]
MQKSGSALENKAEGEKETGRAPLHRVQQAAFFLLVFLCLTRFFTPPLALACGAIFVLIFENPFPDHSKRVSKVLLQICVVFLGFQMNFAELVRVGVSGWIFASFSIAFTLGLGLLIGRGLRLQGKTSLLISSGTAICGGSAIAAVGSVIGANGAQMSMALGTVFMLNAVALYLFPAIGHLLHLSQDQFGLWAGIAIHDISSVVGAASFYGDRALEVATAVKLSRTLWIVPVSLLVAVVLRARHAANGTVCNKSKIQIPYFIGFFVLASFARQWIPGMEQMAPTIGHIAKLGLTVTLFLVGTGLSRATLRAAGWKSLLQGVTLWIFISGISLVAILYL